VQGAIDDVQAEINAIQLGAVTGTLDSATGSLLGTIGVGVEAGSPVLAKKETNRCTTEPAIVDAPLALGRPTTTRTPTRLHCDTTALTPSFGTQVRLVTSPSLHPGLVLASSVYGLDVSTDGGRTFAHTHSFVDPDAVAIVIDLAVLPWAAGRSLVVAQYSYRATGVSMVIGAPLARSDDGGHTWREMVVGLPGFDFVQAVAATPTGRLVAVSAGRGIACSEDGGRTWGPTCPTPEAA
jgi:hypothetical protein